MQRMLSLWLGALVASLVLMAMVPGVLSWGPDEQESPEDEEGSTGDSRGLDPLDPQKEDPDPETEEEPSGGSEPRDLPDEESGDDPEEEGSEDGSQRGVPQTSQDPEEDPDQDEPEEGGEAAEDEGPEQDPSEDSEDPDRSDGPGGQEGGEDAGENAGPKGVAPRILDGRTVPCLQVTSQARCGEGKDPGLRGLRDRLLHRGDQGDQDDEGNSGGPDGPGVQPHARSRVVTPEPGADLLAWGAGLGISAVVVGVLMRLFTVYLLGRGFLPAGWRLDRERVVNHPVRRDILDHLKKRPGATIQELAEGAGVANSRAAYHVSVLKREECVSERVVDGRRHFFLHAAPVVAPDRLRKRTLGRAGRSPGRVLAFLRQSPGATVSHVARALGFSPGHAHYHLTRLAKEGLLDRVRRGRRVRHYLTSEGHELVAEPQEPGREMTGAASVASSRTDEVAA